MRTVSFTHDGTYIAMGSEDSVIDIVRTILPHAPPVRLAHERLTRECASCHASGHALGQSNVATGESVFQVPCRAVTTNIAWHPSRYLLAYASEAPEDRGARDGDICVRVCGLTD